VSSAAAETAAWGRSSSQQGDRLWPPPSTSGSLGRRNHVDAASLGQEEPRRRGRLMRVRERKRVSTRRCPLTSYSPGAGIWSDRDETHAWGTTSRSRCGGLRLAPVPWEHPPGVRWRAEPHRRYDPGQAGDGTSDLHREVANGSGSFLRFETVTPAAGRRSRAPASRP
jgi:hypothetical protein